MEGLNKMITTLRKLNGDTQESLARALEIPRTNLSSYEQGKALPPLPVLKKLASLYKIDIRDLIYTPEEREHLEAESPKVLVISVDADGNENIVLVPEKAAAGYARGYADREFVQELPTFKLPFLSRGTFRAFEIAGDSMLPIPSGSIIIGKYVESFSHLKRGETYLFVTATEGILFKRVADMSNEKILLQSDNPLYPVISMPLSQIREVWKSRMWMSYEFNRGRM